MIFSEIGADHTVDGLKIEFRPRPVWDPYVEAVLARQRQELDTLVPGPLRSGRRDSRSLMLKQSDSLVTGAGGSGWRRRHPPTGER
jgi:hypothetical protein